MRTPARLMSLLVLVTCLGACEPTAQPAPPKVPAAATVAAAPRTPDPSTAVADAGLAIAVARETVDRAVRAQTLHVQQQLREQERDQQQARKAAREGNGNERCLSGQKMRRVANGWVQAGAC